MNESGIYMITNHVNGMYYVGSAKCLPNRRERHWSVLRGGKHWNRHLQRAWLKYGESAFSFSVMRLREKIKKQSNLLIAHM